MKKYLGFMIVVGLLFSFSFAKAEDGGMGNSNRGNSNKAEIKARIDADRSNFRASLESGRASFLADLQLRKNEFKTANADKKREFWSRAKDMLSMRFDIAVNILENVQVRVGAVIDDLHSRGKDTEAASDYLDSSKSELVDAKTKLTEIKNLLPTDGTQITADVFAQIKVDARDAKDSLKESRNDLLQAIKEIKDLKNEDKEESN